MRKSIIVTLSTALALGGCVLAGSVARAEVEQHTMTTQKTTTYSGTVSEIDPSSSTIIVKSETATAPTKYTYTKETVFTDPGGQVVSYDAIRNAPVTVYYTQDGDRMIVSRVVASKPVTKTETHRESSTTETHREMP